MFSRFLKRSRETADIAAVLYGAIVAQARNPGLYTDLAVPDTVEGRFEMVVLHAALVLRHLRSDASAKAVAQEVFDRFCADMDNSLRELGVGDLAVGKRMREMAEAFYGRAGAYDNALAAGDGAALAAALNRAVYEGRDSGNADALARYAEGADATVTDTPRDALLAARIMWPAPSTYAPSGIGA